MMVKVVLINTLYRRKTHCLSYQKDFRFVNNRSQSRAFWKFIFAACRWHWTMYMNVKVALLVKFQHSRILFMLK